MITQYNFKMITVWDLHIRGLRRLATLPPLIRVHAYNDRITENPI